MKQEFKSSYNNKMHSIINLKVWKKYIKRFGKKKWKQGDASCSKSSHVPKFVPVPEPETSCKRGSFEQLSMYSVDSLEEKCLFIRKYGSKKSYNQKSVSLESIITNSIKSDISEDSLQRGSLSKDSLFTSMKEHIRNTNYSAESLKITCFSEKVLLSKCQTRDRSQTVGQSYQLEKLFNRRGPKFFTDDQLHSCSKTSSCYETSLKHEAVSIDSLDSLLSGRFYSLKNQYISKDSLNEEETEYFDKFVNGYRKKSISDSLLYETQYFQHLFHNKDFFIIKKNLSNEIKKHYNIKKILLKSNHDRHSLIYLSELQYIEKCSEDDDLSIDSLSIPKSEFIDEVSNDIPKLSLERNKPFPPDTSLFTHGITENYESEDEKMSIDSLSIPQSELLQIKSSKIIEECFQITENLGNVNCPIETKIHQYDGITIETNQPCMVTTNDRNCNLNGQDLKNSSSTKNRPYYSEYYRNTGKEDSISLDSLYDSLN